MNTKPVYEDDYLWDTGGSGQLESFRAVLPAVLTSGETIVVHGRPRFKAPRKVTCPRCAGELRPGKVTLVFKHAPGEREQEVDGWVCDCGETYVPGAEAREAYRRAMADASACEERRPDHMRSVEPAVRP